MKKDKLNAIFKGALIGGTMLVPGVSGGSMAMILGIYNRLISAVSSFFKNIKGNLIFLLLFVLGAGAGMLIFAKPLLTLIENHTKPMMYFFIGAVAGGIPMICRHAKVEEFTRKKQNDSEHISLEPGVIFKIVIYVAIGLIAVMALAMIPEDFFFGDGTYGKTNLMLQLIAGAVAAIALVLPGISVSYMLLLMGIYDKTMQAISEFDIAFLMPMAIGLLVGIILITKLLEKIMDRYPQPTYLIILGFILGSVVQVFPGLPQNYEWVICGVLVVAGYYLISVISKNAE